MKLKRKLCKLCERDYACSIHHLIPKTIIKKINKDSKLKNMTILLCQSCHREVHYSYVNHLIMNKKCDGYNRLHAISYIVMKDFIKNKHHKVWLEYKAFFSKFLENSFNEFQEVENKDVNLK